MIPAGTVDEASAATSEWRYWAFISYSRADEIPAKWLHSAIERYTLPRKLVGRTMGDTRVPRRLSPLFRDRDELPTSSSLNDSLDEALRQSRNLIVLCSPHAAASRWVNEEILRFRRLGRGDHILCVIVSGEPNAGSDAAAAQHEAFPEALRVVPPDTSPPSISLVDVPLATDLRAGGDGKRLALLKVVAGLVRLPLDELVRRDQRRRRWQTVQATVVLLVALLLGGGAWFNEHRKTQAQREVAAAQALATRAQGLLAGDTTQLPTAALLAVTAWRRALELNLTAEEVLNVMRRSASLLPRSAPLRLQTQSPLGEGIASVDGLWLATRGDKAVLVWDARSGQLAATLPTGDRVDALAFMLDSRQLAVVAGENVQTWVHASASRIGSRHIDGLTRPAALSTDGRWLAAAVDSSMDVGVWDLAKGALTRQLRVDVSVTTLSISPDGRRLAASVAEMSNSGPVDPGWRLWDLDTGQLLSKGKAADYVSGLAFSPHGRMLAISSSNIEVRDATTGRELASIHGSANALVWAPNERWLATSGDPVQVWDVESGDEVARVPAADRLVAFSADGTLVTADGRSWAMNTDRQLEHLLASPGSNAINSIRFAGTARLATAHQSGEVATWQLDAGWRGPTLHEDLAARVLAFSDDGRFVLTMSGNTLGSMWSARLWNAQTGSKLAELAPGGRIEGASFSADGSRLAMIDERGALTLYATSDTSVAASAQLRTMVGGYTMGIVPGSEAWVILGGGAAWLWQAGRSEPKFLNVGENPVFAVATSADGRTLWQAGPGLIIARDPVTLAERQHIDGIRGQIHALSVNHDGGTVAAVIDGAIRIFDGRTGRVLFDLSLSDTGVAASGTGQAELAGVTGMVLSPDGHWLALVVEKRDDQQRLLSDLSLWSVDRHARVAVLEQGVQSAEFSIDGTRLAVIAGDGSVRLVEWIPTRLVADLCARVGRDLTAAERKEHLPLDDGRPACR